MDRPAASPHRRGTILSARIRSIWSSAPLHAMPNDLDIYFHDFPNMDCDKFLHEYFDQPLLLEEHGGFDVLAHIDYPLRVMKHGDYISRRLTPEGGLQQRCCAVHRPRLRA